MSNFFFEYVKIIIMDNIYSFGLYIKFFFNELFFYVFIDEMCKEFGVDDVSVVVVVFVG